MSVRILVAFLLMNSFVYAQSGYTVEALYPQVGQQGTTVDVTIEGNFLQNPEAVLFYDKGIRCTKLKPTDSIFQHRDGRELKAKPGQAAILTFQIDKDARLGEYKLRVRTKDQLSEMVTFRVTPFPVTAEQHPWLDTDKAGNGTRETAQSISLNSTVYGYLPGNQPQDHDFYSVECKRGQRLTVQSVGAQMGTLHYGGMNDPALKVFDATGKELARDDDNSLLDQDAVVSLIVPADGTYFIDMHQQMDYEAGRLRHYLLHVGTFARPMVAFPLGGQAGSKQSITLLGDPKGESKIEVDLPKTVGEYESAYFDVAAPSNPDEPKAIRPNRIHISEFGSVRESTQQTTIEAPQTINSPLPLAIDGKITSEGQVDWYRFTAKKGERYRVRTYAKTLSSDLDARVWIRPAAGNNSNRKYDEDDSGWPAHDLVGHSYRWQIKDRLDPIFVFDPDQDGDWLIGIGDTRREYGPRHVYRIEFQPHVDSAYVHFPAYPSAQMIVRDRIVLFPGSSFSRPLGVQKGFDSKYNGPLQIRATNLPDGVSMNAPTFKQGDGVIPISLTATKDVQVQAKMIDLIVEPVDPKARSRFRGGFAQVSQATNRRGDYAMYFKRSRRMALAIVGGAKFDLQIEQPKVPLVRNGELNLKVKVNRKSGFKGAVYCEMDWLPSGVNKQPPLIIPANKNEGTYKLSARGNSKTGEFPVSITGRENEGGQVRTGAGFHFVSSPFVSLTVGEPYVTLELARTAIERGKRGKIAATINHHKPFQGDATLKLGRLPFGVKQVKPFPKVKAGQKSVAFVVEVTSDCLVGQYKDIFCDVTIQDGGEPIHQQTGNGILRVDEERK